MSLAILEECSPGGNMRDAHIRIDRAAMGLEDGRISSRKLGYIGEQLASLYLEERGMTVVEHNWRCGFGEVDVVCEDDDAVVLVEVKTRNIGSNNDIFPELAVDPRKQNKYRKLALMYLAKQARTDHVRFDIVAIQMTEGDDVYLRYIPAAFEVEQQP